MDARMSGWQAWLDNGMLYPIAGGDDPQSGQGQGQAGQGAGNIGGGDGQGSADVVSRAEYDRARSDASKREKLLRDKQAEFAELRTQFDGVLEALGLDLPEDPEERKQALETMRADRDRARAGKTLSKEEVDRMREGLEKKHAREMERLGKEIEAAKTISDRRFGRLRQVLIHNEAMASATELRATEGGLEAIRLMLEREADVIEDDEGEDEPRAIIRGRDGPRLNAKGEAMTVRERVFEIANDQKYASWFQASGTRGGGTGSQGHTTSSGSGRRRLRESELEGMSMREYEKINQQILSGEIEIVAG